MIVAFFFLCLDPFDFVRLLLHIQNKTKQLILQFGKNKKKPARWTHSKFTPRQIAQSHHATPKQLTHNSRAGLLQLPSNSVLACFLSLKQNWKNRSQHPRAAIRQFTLFFSTVGLPVVVVLG